MKNKKTVQRILKLIGRYKLMILISLILSIIFVISSLALPIFIGEAIDNLMIKDNKISGLIVILIKMGLAIILASVTQWFMNIINNSIVYRIVKDLRIKAFSKIHKLNLIYIDSHQSGEILNKIINDIDQFCEGILLSFSQFFTGILTILLTLIFMFILNPYISLLVIILTPLSMLVAMFISKYSYKYFKNQSNDRGNLSSIVDEMIDGLSTIKNFNTEELVLNEFKKRNNKLLKSSVKALFYSATAFPATRFVNSLIYMSIALFGGVFVINGFISVGNLSSFLTYAGTYTKPFNEISGVIAELQNSIACANSVFEFIDEKELIKDKDDALSLDSVSGNIKIKKLSFSYEKNKAFLENISLELMKGQKVALVGPTGCGKTTFINLLLRFYEIDNGDIEIDNKSIYDIKRRELYKAYGIVFQDTWLKNASIKDNIALSKKDASMSEIIKAAKLANADGFIKRLPDSYDTIVGQNGKNLSVGQRQLISIARIMLTLPPILVLDEATSSIDTRTEIKISEAFDKMMKNRSSFIVAHRLSTIRTADIILVMKDGKIIEKGNHEKLLEAGGFYYQLYNSQFVNS